LIKKLVELTYSINLELKIASSFTIKNLLFNASTEIKKSIMRELTFNHLIELLNDEDITV
jgi:hypothetical protein